MFYLYIPLLLTAFLFSGCSGISSKYSTTAYTPFHSFTDTKKQEIKEDILFYQSPLTIPSTTSQLYYFRKVNIPFETKATTDTPKTKTDASKTTTDTPNANFTDDFEEENTQETDSFDDSFSTESSTGSSTKSIEYWSKQDPFNKYNRSIYTFNSYAYQIFFTPFVKTYNLIAPADVQRGITNMLRNLLGPLRMVTNILKGDFTTAGIEFSKFIVNTTAGIFGYVDITAQDTPSSYQETYFDSTLQVWGVPTGPYVILPLLGPRTTRAVGASIVEIFLNPLRYILQIEPIFPPTVTLRVISKGGFYLELFYTLERTSIDPYTAQREIFWQYTENKEKSAS